MIKAFIVKLFEAVTIEYKDIKHEVQKVITECVYSDCKLDAAGMLIAENTSKLSD